MLEYEIYKTLSDIINNAYPKDKYSNYKLTKFYIELIPKEMKTFHGKYIYSEKKIKIYNLSRNSNHITITTIHEAAHHIDYCIRHTSDHRREFYEIMKKLLVTAISMNIISKNDVLSIVDSMDKERLSRYFGDINSWRVGQIDYKKNFFNVKIINSYKIRDKLSERGYKYSPIDQSWGKYNLDEYHIENEKEYLKGIVGVDDVIITKSNEIIIDAIYYICVHNAYKYKNYLKENGYIFNGFNITKKTWNKKINAHDLDREKEMLKNFQDIKIEVVQRRKFR